MIQDLSEAKTAIAEAQKLVEGSDSLAAMLQIGLLSEKRCHFTTNFAWAIPSDAAISIITDFAGDGAIYELGAGIGLWAALLDEHGATVHAYDLNDTDLHSFYCNSNADYFSINRCTDTNAVIQAVRETLQDDISTMMFCWPSYDENFAAQYVNALGSQIKKLVYIGENGGGCTADSEFHDILESDYDLIEVYNIPHWAGLHDLLFLYERRKD